MTAPNSPMRRAGMTATIPGQPVAQGRGRAVRFGDSVRVIDPAKSRSWKGVASYYLMMARRAAGLASPYDVPLRVEIDAYFKRPKSMKPGPATFRPSRPDADNVAKAVLDAGLSVAWTDDAIVVELLIRKWFAATGDVPRVEVRAEEVAAIAAREGS